MFYIALIIVFIYLLINIIKYKQIPESISDTFYLGSSWLFTLVMIIMGFLVTASLLPITIIEYQCFAFFTGAGLLFVGAAPYFKDEFQSKVHYGGAFIFALSSQVWSAIYYTPWILLLWILSIFIWKTKQRIFWLEMLCIINLTIAYLLG